jgi:hypothetical protein
MFSIMERILNSAQSKPSKPDVPLLSIYDQRINCFTLLTKLQNDIRATDEEYVRISSLEGKSHTNALERLEGLTSEYRKEYALCEKIIKY